MTKAILEYGKNPNLITIDILNHARPRYGNCIGDISGRRSKVQILQTIKNLQGILKTFNAEVVTFNPLSGS